MCSFNLMGSIPQHTCTQRARVNELEEAKRTMAVELERSQATHKETSSLLEETRKSLAVTQQQLEVTQADLSRTQEELQTSQTSIESMKARNGELVASLTQKGQDLYVMEQSLNQLTEEHKKTTKSLGIHTSLLSEARDEIAAKDVAATQLVSVKRI